jgi:hypothetical protein
MTGVALNSFMYSTYPNIYTWLVESKTLRLTANFDYIAPRSR